jgi:hypothetical protein
MNIKKALLVSEGLFLYAEILIQCPFVTHIPKHEHKIT